MNIVLWGVQGSIAGASQESHFYGSNTPCIEVRARDGTLIIFDAGSGLRLLGRTLPASGECHLFLSHAHFDHIQGLGFFPPFDKPHWTTNLYLPQEFADLPQTFFNGIVFPVPFTHLRGNIRIVPLKHGDCIPIPTADNDVRVHAFTANHPGGGMGFKVNEAGTSFLYTGDHEITPDPAVRRATAAMLQDVNLAVVDAMFSRKDYHLGWGHSTWEDWVELAEQARTPTLVLYHHNPIRTDKDRDALQKTLNTRTTQPRVLVAREGMRFTPPALPQDLTPSSEWLAEFLEGLARYKDESTLLDRILAKAREMTRADAGTVFLIEDNELVFAYTHNDTLFPANTASKYAYTNMRLPISTESIVGYAASTRHILDIPDVYALPPHVPYRFNSSFDAKSGYRTCSMLTVPFLDRNGILLGVIQLINSMDTQNKTPQPFTPDAGTVVRQLAREAAGILEVSILMRGNIYSLLRAASIHDPTETGPHAERVGAMVAELYQRWAEKTGVDPDKARFMKSELRLASMLHDIGKVGISDLVLKKPGKLTDEEFAIMRGHTKLGEQLLEGGVRGIASLSSEIARHHHQKWDGTGYADQDREPILKGEEIPLGARITAIADVFDALVSPRCYKKPWSFEDASAQLRREAGTHFDPVLVDCFEEILDTVRLVYARFPDMMDK